MFLNTDLSVKLWNFPNPNAPLADLKKSSIIPRIGFKSFQFRNSSYKIEAILPIIFIPGLIVPIWLSMILNVPYSALAVSLCLGQVIPAILGSFLIKVLKDKIGD